MERPSMPIEEEPTDPSFENKSENKPEKKAEELVDAVNERIKYLEDETSKDFDRTRESHQKAIVFSQNFLVVNEQHVEEDWYTRLHGAIVRYETLFVKKMIAYLNESIGEQAWNPMKAEHMKTIHEEIMSRYIPIYKSYGEKDVAENLQAIAKTIELKLKAGKYNGD